jgi:DNA-binding NarL/FixJ family response regulator
VSLRVIVAEDNPLLRQGLRSLIESTEGIDLVAACADLDELIDAINENVPDVVLTDIRMPPSRTDEGVRAAQHCRLHHPNVAVVLLSQYVDPGYVRTLLSQGTDGRGYLLKERVADVDELVEALRTVAAGGSVMDPKVVESLVLSKRLHGDPDLQRLTSRELEVLGEMAQGRNNGAIAASLFITQRAVEKHINAIFAKLAVGNDDTHPRVRAVLLYLTGRTT